MGYRRPDGRVGVRNTIAVIPSVFCANKTAQNIASGIPGAFAFPHPLGCGQAGEDLDITVRTLVSMAANPNVYGSLVVGLGCERCKPQELRDEIAKYGKPVDLVTIQADGGTLKTTEKGRRIVARMAADAAILKREECDLSELIVAVKCGGTDATSGIAANPALGAMSDLLIAEGGSVILSELNELIGTEDMLAARAVNEEVRRDVYEAVYEVEQKLQAANADPRFAHRFFLISPGNADGGVTSVVEKALGGYYKAGSGPIVEVIPYACAPKSGRRGVMLMNSASHDGEVVTGMVGAGAQIVVFTSGRGSPAGFSTVPVIKVTGNEYTYLKMEDNIDLDTSPIIQGTASIEDMGKILYDMVLDTANGALTKAELLGDDELFCIQRK